MSCLSEYRDDGEGNASFFKKDREVTGRILSRLSGYGVLILDSQFSTKSTRLSCVCKYDYDGYGLY